MKKIIAIILVIICMTISYFAFIYKKLDPAADKIQEMNVIKYSGKAVADFKGAYIEKDKNKINSVLKGLKDRVREPHKGRTGNYNYVIEMEYYDNNRKITIVYQYDLWIENNQMYITMPEFSDKLYRVTRPGRTTILNYLNEIDSKITI